MKFYGQSILRRDLDEPWILVRGNVCVGSGSNDSLLRLHESLREYLRDEVCHDLSDSSCNHLFVRLPGARSRAAGMVLGTDRIRYRETERS